MYCWKCNTKQKLEKNKVGFRDICSSCSFYLHACKNCKYYSPGKPNDCSFPNTEYVSDREKYNFCEEFSPIHQKLEKKQSPDISLKLFGEDFDEKKGFNDLFKNS